MQLRDVFSQGRAIGALQRARDAGRVAHAYIFAGPDGVGKFTTARLWAKVLLCEDNTTQTVDGDAFYDSCGKCSSCLAFEEGRHPDFKPIYKELVKFTEKGKNKKTPVDMPKDVITEFVIDKASAKPVLSKATVFVIREAEKVNASSQNALLKLLEEPPGFCHIILLCSRLDKMLPTTKSRCQVLRFGPVDEGRIVEKLVGMGVEKQEATYWARFSEGSLGTAMDWAGIELKDGSCYGIKRELMEKLCRLSLGDAVDVAEWISGVCKQISKAWCDSAEDVSKTDITRRVQKGVIRMTVAAFKDVMHCGAGATERLVNSDQQGLIGQLAGRMDQTQAAERIAKAYENMRWIDASVNEKLIFEEMLLNYADSGILGISAGKTG